MSTLVFHVWAIGVFRASSKKTDFLVQNMRHEVLLSSRLRSRTMLSKSKHLTPTPSNAARRCAQRTRQCVWQCRSHSEADDTPGAAFFAAFFNFVGHIEFNPPPLLCCNFVCSLLWLFFFLKNWVLGGLAHHNCTSHADLLGCHGSSACNTNSSTHSTLRRIYTSTPLSPSIEITLAKTLSARSLLGIHELLF